MRHIDRLMMATRVGMPFQSTLHHREDADSNRDTVEMQRFVAQHWTQVPLKAWQLRGTGSATRRGARWLRGAALGPGAAAGDTRAGRWWWSGAVLGPGAGSGRQRYGFSCTTALCSMRQMNE